MQSRSIYQTLINYLPVHEPLASTITPFFCQQIITTGPERPLPEWTDIFTQRLKSLGTSDTYCTYIHTTVRL
jgi:hypothetical protein